MGKVSKALAKFDEKGDQTGKSIINKLLVKDFGQERPKKILPRAKRTALPLVCMFLAGIIMGFLFSPVDDWLLAVSKGINPPADRPALPFLEATEKAEVVQTLQTMPALKTPAPQSQKTDTEKPSTVNAGQGTKVATALSISDSQALSWKEEVNVFLQGWEKAWEQSAGPEGNLGDYYSYYAAGFSDGPIDKAAWQSDKGRKNSRKTWIDVELKEVSPLEQSDGSIHVRFVQHYRSSNYSEDSNKSLILIRDDGELKILSERD